MTLPGTTASDVRAGEVTLRVHHGGEGVPLVLLHGWPQHSGIWRLVVEDLIADGHRVIAPDLRGYGGSEAPAPRGGTYAKHAFANDVLALLDALDVDEPVRFVGHDWGAFTGWILAYEHPYRLRSLLALDIGPPGATPLDPKGLAAFAAFASYQYVVATPPVGERLHRNGFAVRKALEVAAARGFAWPPEVVEDYVRSFQAPERAAAASATYRDFLLREVPALARRRYLSSTRIPAALPLSVVFGGAGGVHKLLGDMGASKVPGCEVEVLDGIGHFVPEEAPEAVLRAHRALRARESS